MQAKALVHQLASAWAQIGRNPTGALGDVSPNVGSVVALEMDAKRKPTDVLPGFVGLNSDGIAGPGYFSARYAPFPVIANQRGLAHLSHPEGTSRFETRWNYLMDIDASLRENSPYGKEANDMGDYYESGKLMMYDQAVINAFKFTTDDQTRFGNSSFGDACITARNLLKVNRGARFLTITLGGWDHHNNNIYDDTAGMYPLCANLDAGLANLLKDLAATTSPERAGTTLLDDTLIVVMGEFGRTVGALNEAGGRDHFLRQFALFARGGVKGGRALGQTDAAGSSIVSYGWAGDRDVRNEDISATLYSALGIDYTTVRYDDPLGRGFEYVPMAKDGVYTPVDDLFK